MLKSKRALFFMLSIMNVGINLAKPPKKSVINDRASINAIPSEEVHVNFNDRGAKKLPDSILLNTNLKVLDVSNNSISTLPEAFTNLQCLEHLICDGNSLQNQKVPEVIYKIQSLRALYLDRTDIKELGDGLGMLENLEILHAANNVIEQFPASIWTLPNLERLYLGNNRINSVPEYCGGSSLLKYFDLGNNTKIERLPNNLGELKNLESVTLAKTGLSAFPTAVSSWHKLKRLDLGFTNITEIPEFVGKLSKLEVLILEGTKINVIPDFIGNMKNLKILNLSNTEITAIPKSILNLAPTITSLDLKGIKIPTSSNGKFVGTDELLGTFGKKCKVDEDDSCLAA